ncbi:DUF4148 domain-containing protein [Paraburkholderia sp. J7]|uniref:DUF4148 domain-containing protein n=1 Tax=Paraburkholderia sp. J7 TaxID=2805438 RepID=UPI002AB68CBC|nr:DUF4148 domain-containing protein [Paraburkholderia sp. J7]
MNRTLILAALAAALLIPALSFAQPSNGSPTRDQVREELAQLVKAGYKPTGRDNKYPSDLHAAQARVAAAAAAHQAAPATAPNWQNN